MKLIYLIIISMNIMAQENFEEVAQTLEKELDEHYELFLEESTPKVIGAVKLDLSERKSRNMKEYIPQEGDKAIDFSLINLKDKKFNLYNALEKGPIVLFWYRGGWCSYCNMQLAYYQNYQEEIQKLGARMVGIAPENPVMGNETKEDNEISFELLTDTNNTIAREYKIVYTVKPMLYQMMNKAFDLYDYYDKTNSELPLTVLYVIDTKGIIRYAFINDDFTKRAEPKEFIKALRDLKDK